MLPMSSSPHKLVSLPCGYYLLVETKKFNVMVPTSGISFIPDLGSHMSTNISSMVVLQLNSLT
jgi:hypothetical protein